MRERERRLLYGHFDRLQLRVGEHHDRADAAPARPIDRDIDSGDASHVLRNALSYHLGSEASLNFDGFLRRDVPWVEAAEFHGGGSIAA